MIPQPPGLLPPGTSRRADYNEDMVKHPRKPRGPLTLLIDWYRPDPSGAIGWGVLALIALALCYLLGIPA